MTVRVASEPLTYAAERRERSFFADLVTEARGESAEALNARERLGRHNREVRVELAERERRVAGQVAAVDGLEFGRERRLSSRVPGFGGSFAPPLWLIDRFATAPRPGRVLADLIPGFPLPSGVSSVNVPRFVAGNVAQAATDGAAAPSADWTDAAVSSPCAPIAGHSDVALSLLELAPRNTLDIAVWRDLTEAYDAHLEALLVNGVERTGSKVEFNGLLNYPTGPGGVNAITYTDASPTGAKLFPSFGQAAAQIGDNRLAPPEIWAMRTARWCWLGSAEDGQGLPLAVPGHTPPPRIPGLLDDRRTPPVAPLLGWPIFPNDSIPANLGAGQNQDAIIACRPSDMLLFESEPVVGVDLESLSGALGARITFRAYAAFLGARRPTGIATITGTGLVVQSGE